MKKLCLLCVLAGLVYGLSQVAGLKRAIGRGFDFVSGEPWGM